VSCQSRLGFWELGRSYASCAYSRRGRIFVEENKAEAAQGVVLDRMNPWPKSSSKTPVLYKVSLAGFLREGNGMFSPIDTKAMIKGQGFSKDKVVYDGCLQKI